MAPAVPITYQSVYAWCSCEEKRPSKEEADKFFDTIKPLLEKYQVTAFVAGHDHCMETFVDGGVDHHGMGSAHENDHSTVRLSKSCECTTGAGRE